MSNAKSSQFDEILTQADPQVEALARRARALIQEIMLDVVEVVWPAQKIASYGVGPKKMSEHFCYIAVFKQRINLGFYYGADLEDPSGLLEGTGKLLRHVKVSTLEQLDDPALRRLVLSASTYLPKLN
jgi:hypothetical protein